MHQFSKISRTLVFSLWKCRVICLGGMQDRRCVHVQRVGGRCDYKDGVGVWNIIYTREDFYPRTKKTSRRAARPYAALNAGLVSDHPVLRGREKPELYETNESRETRRNKDNLMPWGDPVQVLQKQNEAERQEGFTEKLFHHSCMCVFISAISHSLFLYLYIHFG